jgi:hypothetical protein
MALVAQIIASVAQELPLTLVDVNMKQSSQEEMLMVEAEAEVADQSSLMNCLFQGLHVLTEVIVWRAVLEPAPRLKSFAKMAVISFLKLSLEAHESKLELENEMKLG